MAHILARVQVYGHELVSTVPNRFESTAVQERVFKVEYNTWSIFIPGSRVQFLSPVEARHLQPRPTTCFSPISQKPFTSFGNQENHSMSPGIMLEPDTSRTSPHHLQRGYPAVVACPDVPILHNPDQIQKLFKLMSQPRPQRVSA